MSSITTDYGVGALPFMISLIAQAPLQAIVSQCTLETLVSVITHLQQAVMQRTDVTDTTSGIYHLEDGRTLKLHEADREFSKYMRKIEEVKNVQISKLYQNMRSVLISWALNGESKLTSEYKKNLSKQLRDSLEYSDSPDIKVLSQDQQNLVFALAIAGVRHVPMPDFLSIYQNHGSLITIGAQLRSMVQPFLAQDSRSHPRLNHFLDLPPSSEHNNIPPLPAKRKRAHIPTKSKKTKVVHAVSDTSPPSNDDPAAKDPPVQDTPPIPPPNIDDHVDSTVIHHTSVHHLVPPTYPFQYQTPFESMDDYLFGLDVVVAPPLEYPRTPWQNL
ncbi:hypothetical protein GQ44DRAFT_777170 [Phaeosphaeriaceae sp. PMI808]|nr:hypothetical protein GQ44DRAFT_777170 [Phaeosphaeriaceae sp. PMI808]